MTTKQSELWLLRRDNALMIETQEKLVKQLRGFRRRRTYSQALRDVVAVLEGFYDRPLDPQLAIGMVEALKHPVNIKRKKPTPRPTP